MKTLAALAAIVAAVIGVSVVAPKNKDYLPPNEGEIVHMEDCPKVSGEAIFLDGEGKTYIHCKMCGIGALLEHEDDVLRCTHCGKR